ncbi:phage tail tape measure protein [Pseudomonas sp. LP_7_YM]|uniref:phage tail tape measure protein n=1 Tax=Pseudomonas sp. LP_7_YM TaxID=2485137 RepID=UPI00105D063C|nr:phage tail tape measure protein [Pseudomonas sp. LP_7_YM]TDV60121.1 TP901 family phage tail tape measure protein [Pseudomonas sp. LP_7_YM]
MADQFQLKALITGVDKLSPTLAGIRKNVANFRKGLQNTGLGNLSFRDVVTGGALAAPFVMGTRAAIQFESAMADVRKVVNFDTPDQFKAMGEDITKMSERLPMAANDIAKIVAAGGQSGIGRGELLGFAQDAVKMGIAFDQTAEESGDMMAKWRTSFKMTQAEVVGLADKINYLGNTGPANTKQISDIVTRVGPLGEVAGVASGQIAALGATMAGTGVEQEVAATGIKNFMLALTKGSAATKSQSSAMKSLRLNSKAVAAGMQKDAQGTMLQVLKRIADVDAVKRPALLTNLFGTESVAAISPLLTNLGLLESNLKKTGDASQYAGSMEAEYASRAATTENNLTLMRNAVSRAGIALGNAFLPVLNAVVEKLRPFISQVGDLIQANPMFVRGLAAAGAAFTAIRVGALAAMVATRLLTLAFAATPIGIAAVAIAAAVGLIVANWDTLAPYFQQLWDSIKGPAMIVWGWMKTAFRWSPVGQIIANWQPISIFLGALWDVVKAAAGLVMDFLKSAFNWAPMTVVARNWQPLSEFFSALWDVIRAVTAAAWTGIKDTMSAAWGWIKEQIGFDPVQIVTAAWDPLVAYFKGLFEKIRPFIQPLMDAGNWAGDKAGAASDWVKGKAGEVSNFFSKSDPTSLGADVINDGTQGLRRLAVGFNRQAEPAPAIGGPILSTPTPLLPGAVLPAPGNLLTGASNKSQLNGELVIRLEGDTRGVRPQPAKTDQPGLKVSTNVGYRSLSGAQ